jgi:hypothetical protein
MPNYCNNAVYLEHDMDGMIDRAEAAYKEGRFLDEFVPIPEDLKNPKSSIYGGPEAVDYDAVRAENLKEHGYKNWYDFCVDNWGTKWDVGGDDANILRSDKMLILNFDSAWGPPLGALNTMLDMGFRIKAYYWEPGMTFAGVWNNGEDDFYDYGECYKDGKCDVDQLEDLLPEELDHEFNIVQSISDWQEEG